MTLPDDAHVESNDFYIDITCLYLLDPIFVSRYRYIACAP